jgi:Secretion system C-terminal sorting domain
VGGSSPIDQFPYTHLTNSDELSQGINGANDATSVDRKYAIKITSTDSSGNQGFKNINMTLAANSLSDFIITATPNPSSNSFSLTYKANAGSEAVSLKLYNAQGSLLQEINNVFPGQTINMGNSLLSGVYYLSAIKANSVKTIKLLKL